MLALVQTTRPGYASAISFGGWKQVWLGTRFKELDEAQQAAVIAHEEGHCHLHHLEARWLCLLLTPMLYLWLCKQQEFAADRYAAERGHATALCSILASEYDGGWFQPSHAERRAALKHHDQTRLVSVKDFSRPAGVTEQRK